jgi:REP element-mobilizing transposase RayT
MPDYRRRLPHIHPHDAHIFLTWRLWGSLPRLEPSVISRTPAQSFLRDDRSLDEDTSGPRWLEVPAVADLVAEAILAGESERRFYELHAWVVMPNHVHMLLCPKEPLRVITHWLKGRTAREANKLLGRTGLPFWRDESWDHYLRMADQIGRTANYIERNPVSAKLAARPEAWRWSSAWAG